MGPANRQDEGEEGEGESPVGKGGDKMSLTRQKHSRGSVWMSPTPAPEGTLGTWLPQAQALPEAYSAIIRRSNSKAHMRERLTGL
jgi:hypothetical protein